MDQPLDFLKFVRPAGIPWALLLLLVTVVLARVLSSTLDGLGQRFADRRLLIHQVGSILRFVLFLLGGLGSIALVAQLTNEVFLAVGGTAAVSIGFALKDLVSSLVAGVTILMDKPFQVGDRVTFEGSYGEIRSIGLRSTRLITLDDTQVTIPNNKFLTEAVASGNAGEVEMMVQIDFLIGADQEIAKAKRIVEEALTSSRYVHLKRTWVVLVSAVTQDSYFAVRLRAKGYVLDVKFEKLFESDVTERVLEGFADASIQPPAVLHRSLSPSTSPPPSLKIAK